MKKILLVASALFAFSASASASGESSYSKCVPCHGENGNKKALGRSDVISGLDKKEIEKKLNGYRDGTLNLHGMGSIMISQMSSKNDKEIESLSKYISTFKKN